PRGAYSVCAYFTDGTWLIFWDMKPRDYEFKVPWIWDASSSAIARYRTMHRVARARGKAPSIPAGTVWLKEFEPGLLKDRKRRSAVIAVLRKTISTGRGRTRPAHSKARALAMALTAAFLGRTPDSIRKALVARKSQR